MSKLEKIDLFHIMAFVVMIFVLVVAFFIGKPDAVQLNSPGIRPMSTESTVTTVVAIIQDSGPITGQEGD